MSIKRTAIWLIMLGAMGFLAGRASAQPAHSGVYYPTPTPNYENASAPFAEDGSDSGHSIIEPFHPVGFEPRFDWFAPAETSSYGRGQKANIGYFASYERLYWSLSAPETALVGSDATIIGYSVDPAFPDGTQVDNRFLGATGAWGNRWEVGYIDTDDYGWLVSVLDHVSQGQYRIVESPTSYFGDPARILNAYQSNGGALLTVPPGGVPVATVDPSYGFGEYRMKNILQLNGVELSRFYRARRLHSGAYFELIYGVRWLQINDTFWVQGDGNGSSANSYTGNDGNGYTVSRNLVDGSQWSLRALNNLVGPQVGVRFFRKRERWVTSVAARFLAAANFQNLHLKANFGTNLNANLAVTSALTRFRGLGLENHLYTTTFAPVGEIRVNVGYNVTRAVTIQAGYTGLVVGDISRASNSINYDSPNLVGIRLNDNQLFFANGINFGVTINR